MIQEKFKIATKPNMTEQTLFQITQMKNFVDSTLKQAVAKDFKSEEEKIKYLLDSLYNIRDFCLTVTNENSLRLRLLQQFEEIEKEIEMGNDLQEQEEKSLENLEEDSEQNQLN